MKRYMILSILAVFCTAIISRSVTETSGMSPQGQHTPQNEPEIVFDGQSPFNDIYIPAPQVRTLDNILWKKTVWRMIDMREQVNFSLYYPLEESNGRVNLYLTIFRLLKEGKVNAYEYFEEREEFTDEYKLSFPEILEESLVDIYELQIDDNGDSIYIINDVDVNSKDVLKFFIKEVWYFDAMESCMKFKIEAIAPQLTYFDEGLNTEAKKALYWVPFDELRPWLAKQSVVINNKNSTSFISYDDLFQKRRFVGYIYKEDNIQNRTLLDYCNTPQEVRSEQIRIENEIMNFEFDLWEF